MILHSKLWLWPEGGPRKTSSLSRTKYHSRCRTFCMRPSFSATHFTYSHLRDAHAAARQRGRPWSAVLTRIDLGFTFVHRKLSRGSQRPSSSLSFWHYFCSWYKFPRLRHAVHHDSGRPPCSPQRVLLPCLSYLLIIHPTRCQLRRWRRLATQTPSTSRAPAGRQLLSCVAHPTCLRCSRMAGCGCAKELGCWKPGRRLTSCKLESGL